MSETAPPRPRLRSRFSQARNQPVATYAPWLDDAAFRAVHDVVAARKATLVDVYRCYEMWHLVGQVARTRGDILEVGVWRGGTGCIMARRAQLLGAPARVFLCDTFQGVVKAGPNDTFYKGGEFANTSAELVRGLADTLGLDNIEIMPGIFPEDTGLALAARRFALCHIDVDVYLSARDVLNWVWPRLYPGGAVVFDDYGFPRCDGITQLVNEQFERDDAVTLHNLNGHAVMIKRG